MNWAEAQQAFTEAERTINATKDIACGMAKMLSGRLKAYGIPSFYLKELKRELRDYDMHRGVWRR